jgi:CubicO group peptidase (beta-lactamase class C family)
MKKTLLVIALCLSCITLWILDPLSYNPFSPEKTPVVNSSINFNCLQNDSIKNSQFKNSADSILASYMNEQRFLGVSIGFSKKACGRYVAGSGISDKSELTAVNGEMLSRIASITKPMTAIAIMQLFEQGIIDLDQPINTYLPNLTKLSKTKITVRQLLSHTSGIPHYKSKLDAVSFSHYDSLELAAMDISARGVVATPGTTFIYSSYGYTILGAIIEKMSKLSFAEYLQKNIWQKAKMNDTSLEEKGSYANKTKLYLKVGSNFIRSPINDLSIIYSAGGVQSTAADLLKFGEAILSNRLISRKTLEMMIDVSRSLAPDAGDDPYGLGWVVHEHPSWGKVISHSGGQPGASSYFEIYLDREIVVATLSNAFGTKNSSYQLAKDMAAITLR